MYFCFDKCYSFLSNGATTIDYWGNMAKLLSLLLPVFLYQVRGGKLLLDRTRVLDLSIQPPTRPTHWISTSCWIETDPHIRFAVENSRYDTPSSRYKWSIRARTLKIPWQMVYDSYPTIKQRFCFCVFVLKIYFITGQYNIVSNIETGCLFWFASLYRTEFLTFAK